MLYLILGMITDFVYEMIFSNYQEVIHGAEIQ